MSYLSSIDNYVGLTEIGDLSSIVDRLKRHSLDRLADFCSELVEHLPTPNIKDENFRYVGNSAYSGLPHPCSGFDCRSQNISISASFAATYANHLVLFNPFYGLGRLASNQKKFVRGTPIEEQLAFHVSEILILRPLIDRGIVSFEHEDEERYCPDCTQKALDAIIKGSNAEFGSDSLYFDFIDHFANNSLVEYRGSNKNLQKFFVTSTAEMAGHRESYFYREIQKPLRLKEGQLLSKQEIFKTGIAENFAHFAGNDIVAASNISDRYNIGNMIGGSSQLKVLQNYFGRERFSRAVDIEYPLLSQTSLSHILSFRDQEWHHLHDFRQLVEDGIKSGEDVDRQLADSSSKMQSIVIKARVTSERDIIKQVGVSATAIAATVVTSGFSGLIAAAIGVLGTGHFAAGIVPKIIDRFSEPTELRDQKSYYAWKIRGSSALNSPINH